MDVLPFADWLQVYVRDVVDYNQPIDEDIVRLSQPPSKIAYTYGSMWAYGNHYRVDKEAGECHATYDSGSASSFMQGSCSSARDRNIIIANIMYVGVLKEILLVKYLAMNRILFGGSWIPSNLVWMQIIH